MHKWHNKLIIWAIVSNLNNNLEFMLVSRTVDEILSNQHSIQACTYNYINLLLITLMLNSVTSATVIDCRELQVRNCTYGCKYYISLAETTTAFLAKIHHYLETYSEKWKNCFSLAAIGGLI